MDNFQNKIDSIVSKILNEEIEKKSEEMSEKLHGGQKKLDKNKNGRVDAEDFKLLKKKETKEFFYPEDDSESIPGDYEGDEAAENDAEELSNQEPMYVGRGLSDNKPGKMFGSFNDEHGFYDEKDRQYTGDFDFDFDEEEFDNFDDFDSKYGGKQKMFAKGDEGRKFFDAYKNKFKSPFKVRTRRDMEEQETEEGNAFSGALADAKKSGKDSFKVDGKSYQVKESVKKKETKEEENWIQKTDMKKGALRKKLGVPEGEKIPKTKLNSLKKELMKRGEGDKKLSNSDSKLLKQVNLALNLKDLKENNETLRLSEDELIDMIEKIVSEQKTKNNIQTKTPIGLREVEKANKGTEKVSSEYIKSVNKKLKEYLKNGSKGEYNESPEMFPQSNYSLDKMKEKTAKYHPSQAVDEYIEAFAYPGMTNLVYDEIKPDDKRIDKYLKGDSTTGNAVKDKSGKALGNVVPSEVGERFKKNFDDNLYGAEQMNVSYKRQPQPVDVGGSEKVDGSLKSIRKGSTKKAEKIMSQLESKQDEKKKSFVNEEMEKMKNHISYNRKTQ